MFPSLPMLRDDPTPIDVNCTQGIQWIWIVFRECAVTPKEITAVTFGLISAVIWIIFAIPQIIENYRKGIPDQALSPILLLCFLMGDTVNLLGCIFVHQLPLQVKILSSYFISSVNLFILTFPTLKKIRDTGIFTLELSAFWRERERLLPHYIQYLFKLFSLL